MFTSSYFCRSLEVVWIEYVAQCVVFLCSSDIRIFFYLFLFFFTSFICTPFRWCLSPILLICLRVFHSLQQDTCIGILQDLLWLSAPKTWRKKKNSIALVHLCGHWERKKLFFFSLFTFYFYVGRRLYLLCLPSTIYFFLFLRFFFVCMCPFFTLRRSLNEKQLKIYPSLAFTHTNHTHTHILNTNLYSFGWTEYRTSIWMKL